VHREGGKQEVERRERKEGGDFFANRRGRERDNVADISKPSHFPPSFPPSFPPNTF
jgi:hypothetical protein